MSENSAEQNRIRTSLCQSSMMSIPIGEHYEHPVYVKPFGVLTLGPAEKYSDVRGSFWRYQIMQDEQPKGFHRYSEFLWLRNELIKRYPGLCIPALPDKEGISSYWSSHSEDFIRFRRHGLEQFLQFCGMQNILRETDLFKSFLNDDEYKFALTINLSQSETGYFSYLTEWSSSIVSSVTKYVYGAPEGVFPSGEDKRLTEDMSKITALKVETEEQCENAKALLAKKLAEADSNFALAKAYENLARVEESEGLKRQLEELAVGHQQISDKIRVNHRAMSNLFGEQLEDALRISRGGVEAIQRRQEIVEKIMQANAALVKQGYSEKSFDSESIKQLKEQLERITNQLQGNIDEIFYLHQNVLTEVASAYVRLQLELHVQLEDVWKGVQQAILS